MTATKRMTVNEVAAGFGVSLMTIYCWRRGTVTKKKLPFVEAASADDGRRKIAFDQAKVEKWAAEHGLSFAPQGKTSAGRSGPIPKKRERKKIKH